MNNTIKGALAAGGAAVILLGGAGSLAYWSADGTVTGGQVNSGQLKLGEADCGSWKLGSTDFNITTGKLVPGDTLTKTCTYDITAIGENLSADLAVSTPASATGSLANKVDVDGAFTVEGKEVETIDSSNNNDTLSSTVTVTFPYGTSVDNDSQNVAATLSSYVVTAKQTRTL